MDSELDKEARDKMMRLFEEGTSPSVQYLRRMAVFTQFTFAACFLVLLYKFFMDQTIQWLATMFLLIILGPMAGAATSVLLICENQMVRTKIAIQHESLREINKRISDIKCYTAYRRFLRELVTIVKSLKERKE